MEFRSSSIESQSCSMSLLSQSTPHQRAAQLHPQSEYSDPGPDAVEYDPDESAGYVSDEHAAGPWPTTVPATASGYGQNWEPRRVRYNRDAAVGAMAAAAAVGAERDRLARPRVTTPRPVINHRGTPEPGRTELAVTVTVAATTGAGEEERDRRVRLNTEAAYRFLKSAEAGTRVLTTRGWPI